MFIGAVLAGQSFYQSESFGAAYAVGWFDDIAAMEKLCDRYKGKRRIHIQDGKFRLE